MPIFFFKSYLNVPTQPTTQDDNFEDIKDCYYDDSRNSEVIFLRFLIHTSPVSTLSQFSSSFNAKTYLRFKIEWLIRCFKVLLIFNLLRFTKKSPPFKSASHNRKLIAVVGIELNKVWLSGKNENHIKVAFEKIN